MMSLLALAAVSCEKVTIEDKTELAPVISSFTPLSAPVGAEVVITGEYLQNVVRAYVGEVPVVISQKVSDTRLSIRITEDVTQGAITLESSIGKASSEQTFTASYAVPSINTGIMQTSAELSGEMLLSGENMNSVIDVLFTAAGPTKSEAVSRPARIVSRSNEEIVLVVPYVESSNATICLSYNDGRNVVTTEPVQAPEIIRYVPVFKAYSFVRTNAGKSITLEGEHLDKVDRIVVGRTDEDLLATNISKSEKMLTFTVPAGDAQGEFPDGETKVKILAEYFDGYEAKTLSEDFTVNVPFVKFWENITLSSHGKTGANTCFFGPETGVVYANSDWRTIVDPVSYANQGSTCTAAQLPNKSKVSEEEYNGVKPYFFFYINNSNVISINSPANSNGLLKNFWIGNLSGDANRLPGINGNCWGTAVMGYRYLSEANETEKAIIDAVRNQTLEKIDEKTFPIDVANLTCGGVSVSTLSGANSDWSKGVIADADLKKDGKYDINKVVMVFYFDYDGYDSKNEARLANVKRIGFVNVKKIDFKIDPTNSSSAALLSEITFNCYWQKYDYDFSKLAD